jgi:hypothetical protein
MTSPKAPATYGGFRKALAGFLLFLALVLLAWRLFTPRDHTLAELKLPEDQLRVQVLARKAVFGSIRLYLVVEEDRLGESQRLYLRTWDGTLKELGAPRVERPQRHRLRVTWSVGVADEAPLALRVLQPEPPK